MNHRLAPLFGYGHLRRTTLGGGVVRPAAGVLLRLTDADGDWWLLGKRTARLGGTWSNFGGSLDADETPLAGALRELTEETGITAADLAGATIAAEYQTGTDAIPYTLFVIDLPAEVNATRVNREHDDVDWFHGDDVAALDLHHGLADHWPTIRPTNAAAAA